jgi:hypothetical protein
VIGAFLTARPAAAIARQVFSNSRVVVMLALGVIGGAFAIAAPRVPAVAFAAVGMLLVALAIEVRERSAGRLPSEAHYARHRVALRVPPPPMPLPSRRPSAGA